MNYANAFADPVPEKSQRGLIGESIARLGQYVHDVANGYGIEAERFWFSPSNRHPLKCVDGNQEKDVDGVSSDGKFDEFVGKVMNVVNTGKTSAAVNS